MKLTKHQAYHGGENIELEEPAVQKCPDGTIKEAKGYYMGSAVIKVVESW